MLVAKRSGKVEPFSIDKIRVMLARCGAWLEVDCESVAQEVVPQLYDGIKSHEIQQLLILTARSRIAEEPDYSYFAARLLLKKLYKEVIGDFTDASFDEAYRDSFKSQLFKLIEVGRLNPKMGEIFNLDVLAAVLKPSLDFKFKYLGAQTLYDRYFQHIEGVRCETPQAFWMRVAMGISLNEDDPTKRAVEFYNQFSNFNYCPSTPTLFNSGTLHSQLSSCYVHQVGDSIDGIFGSIHGQARLSKYAGGLGVDWTAVRGNGAYIKGTNGPSQGVIPWLKIFNDTLVGVNQGSKRKGAGCSFLEVWHIDFFDFLDLRKNTGDERRRCHDMNTSSWIPDLFMERVKENGEWTMFSPDEVPDLHELYGKKFKEKYEFYEKQADEGKIRLWNRVKAKDLARKMFTSLFETGHPFACFKDACNIRYTGQHLGVIHSANLCQEFLHHTIPDKYDNDGNMAEVGETSVCNLSSVNLASHVNEDGEIDYEKLAKTIYFAVRGMDNVIDINFYPIKSAEKSNLNNRPVGLGKMGWTDLLHAKGIPFDSNEAVELADEIQEFISYHAILTSISLAKERGVYPNYNGSLWDLGVLPIDSYVELMIYRGKEPNIKSKLDWSFVRNELAAFGMRNDNVMAIAPTACVTGDTIVLSSEGLLPIDSIGDPNGEQWQEKNFLVAQENCAAEATSFYVNGKKRVVSITTKRGHKISCTKNHRLRVIDENGEYVWKFAGELRKGDLLVRKVGGHEEILGGKDFFVLKNDPTPIHHNENDISLPEKLDEELAELIGYYVGDGYLRDRDFGIIIGHSDIDLVDVFSEKLTNIFGGKPSVENRPEKSVSVIHYFSKRLERWWGINGFRKPTGMNGEGSAGAFVPTGVLKSRTSVLCAFLRGLFEAEGTITIQRTGSPTVDMSTVSERLAREVQACLESLGVVTTLKSTRSGSFGYRRVWRIRPSSIGDVRTFAEKIGFISERKKEKLRASLSVYYQNEQVGKNITNKKLVGSFCNSALDHCSVEEKPEINTRKSKGVVNYGFIERYCEKYEDLNNHVLASMIKSLIVVPITKIEDGGIQPTYDLSVPSRNTYLANGFVSHNTISSIVGCSQSIEPDFSALFVYSTLSGEFVMINEWLVYKLKKLGLWSKEIVSELKANDGDVSTLNIPQYLKDEFKTAFQVDYRKLIEAAAARQKWIDMGMSLNLYCDQPSLKYLSDMYFYAWETALKTTYYLRAKGASKVEKAVVATKEVKECSIEAMRRGEHCESCE